MKKKKVKKKTAKKTMKSAKLAVKRKAKRPAKIKVIKGKRKLTAWELRLYVAGKTQKSIEALENLKKICETHLFGIYFIEVIDLLEQPQLAKGDQIVATPTLVKKLPTPVKRIIGDLSDTERVLVGLNLRPLR